MMKTKKSGEFRWIEDIRHRFAPLVPAGWEGIGDDCAVVPLGRGQSGVVTSDMLVEDVHFVRTVILPEDLGYKSLAVNLSDVAAMGATPTGTFLSVGLPADIDEVWREAFLSGYQELSEEFGVPLLGGDTTAADKIVISVTALGSAPQGHIKRRSGAKPGDVICVTGPLGDSAAGLLLQGQTPENEEEKRLIAAHHRPKPHVRAGIWLGSQPAVHAMMDISDGIASDLRHIIEASDVAAHVDLERLPLSDALRRTAKKRDWDIEKLAAAGGEDYVLLLAAERDTFDELNRHFTSEFGTKLSPIGQILAEKPIIDWCKNGITQPVDWQGFSHF